MDTNKQKSHSFGGWIEETFFPGGGHAGFLFGVISRVVTVAVVLTSNKPGLYERYLKQFSQLDLLVYLLFLGDLADQNREPWATLGARRTELYFAT